MRRAAAQQGVAPDSPLRGLQVNAKALDGPATIAKVRAAMEEGVANVDKDLNAILRDLQALDITSLQNGVSRCFLEVRDTNEGKEVTVRANREGLVYLAKQLVELASSASPDQHLHIDEAGMADHCDRNLVLAYCPAPWD